LKSLKGRYVGTCGAITFNTSQGPTKECILPIRLNISYSHLNRLETLRPVIPDVVERYEDLNITIKDRVYFPKFPLRV